MVLLRRIVLILPLLLVACETPPPSQFVCDDFERVLGYYLFEKESLLSTNKWWQSPHVMYICVVKKEKLTRKQVGIELYKE